MANTDGTTPVINNVMFAFEAKGVRLLPVTYSAGISLRWELYGCLEGRINHSYI